MRMRFCPSQRLLFRIKKTINDYGAALSRIPRGRSRCFAIDYCGSGINGHTCCIRKDNFAAVGNFFWIDGAMLFVQP